ncbi:MAG: VWA domain-containing protein, partial [Robiginitalea sp.]
QRQVRFIKPSEAGSFASKTDLWILYQPDRTFNPVYDLLKSNRAPVMTLTGVFTDWDYLNQAQQTFRLQEEGPQEEVLPELNPAFGYFDGSDWDISNYPPLSGTLGDYFIKPPHEALLGQRVMGISLKQPLLALIRGDQRREAVLFGNGIWKWRMGAFAANGDFGNFDAIFGKIWLFLTAGQETDRLNLEYLTVYNGQQPAVIRARYFDEALRFDPGATLNLQISDSTGIERASYPLPLGKGYYEADISNLLPGTYTFNVKAEGTDFAKTGQFRLLAFDLENQRLSSDLQGLSHLAQTSGGYLYFPGNLERLKDSLLLSERFRPVQRTRRNVVSLIDYWWLLALIAIALGTEWFIRKYIGLI